MNTELFNLGYYICQIEDTPPYLKKISNKFISLSGCLCTHEPQISLCHGWRPHGDNIEYMKKHGLTEEQYLNYSNEIQNAFDNKKFFFDGRFTDEKDAKYFYYKYFKSDRYILTSFATEGAYFEKLVNDGFEQSKQLISLHTKQILGYDIIGWDIGGFHSFLCNSLHEEFEEITFSKYGLVELDFSIVKKMAESIQGRGEPVEWVPVIIYSPNYE